MSSTTDQFVTAPKLAISETLFDYGLTTSQFVTAPKPIEANSYLHKDGQTDRDHDKTSRNSWSTNRF